MAQSSGGRTIFILFWVVGSIFWIMAGSLSGNFTESLFHIIFGWVILYVVFLFLDLRKRKED